MLKKSRKKVFCIGRNKTGTTSVGAAFRQFGLKVGDQFEGERLMSDWVKRDFRRIVKFSRTADAFQDVPFSLSYTYQALDAAFPNAKFVLTIRDSANQWYESLIRFHTKMVGKNRLPTASDLKAFEYHSKGWLWKYHQAIYDIDEFSLYDPVKYKAHYLRHNERVVDYFRYRKNDLLVLNVGEQDAYKHLCEFLKMPWDGTKMPHENSSLT